MPARRERLYLCPRDDGHPGWIVDFPVWWNRRGFFETYDLSDKPESRWIDTGNPWHMNYALLLTLGEAAAWDDRCRTAFASDPRSRDAYTVDAMHDLKTKLSAAEWVVVESYEWESGLD